MVLQLCPTGAAGLWVFIRLRGYKHHLLGLHPSGCRLGGEAATGIPIDSK